MTHSAIGSIYGRRLEREELSENQKINLKQTILYIWEFRTQINRTILLHYDRIKFQKYVL